MNYKILLLLAISFSLSGFAQNGVKVYGYVQDVQPGTVPVGTGENTDRKNQDLSQYLIYLAGSAKSILYPVEIWINGKAYSVSTEKVSTPVQIKTGSNGTKTLVPKTSNKVWKLSLLPYMPGKNFSKAREKAQSNELVVVYKMNGSFYSAVLKNITRLEPQLNE